MNNIVIFSHHDLVRTFLKGTVESIIMMSPKRSDVVISTCYSLQELESEILTKSHLTVIFDLDEVSKFEQFCIFKHAQRYINKNHLFLFTSESEVSTSYETLAQVSPFILSKTAPPSQIEAMLYQLIFCSKTSLKVKCSMPARSLNRKERAGLTQRESEICRHLLSGLSNKDISILLGISNKTVSSHRTNIYNKYQSKNLLELYSRFKV